METWELLRQAIEERRQVVAGYNGRMRAFCPHALGFKGEKRHVLVYQFDAERQLGERPTTGWRCLEVERLESPSLRDGDWRTAANVFNPQSCLDDVVVAVRAFPPLLDDQAVQQASEPA
jgi:hypothetical protein